MIETQTGEKKWNRHDLIKLGRNDGETLMDVALRQLNQLQGTLEVEREATRIQRTKAEAQHTARIRAEEALRKMIEFAEAVEPYAGHLSTVPWPLVRFARATLTGNASEAGEHDANT